VRQTNNNNNNNTVKLLVQASDGGGGRFPGGSFLHSGVFGRTLQRKSQEGLNPQQQRCANIKSPAEIFLFSTTVNIGPGSVQLGSEIVPAVKEYGEGMYSSTHWHWVEVSYWPYVAPAGLPPGKESPVGSCVGHRAILDPLKKKAR